MNKIVNREFLKIKRPLFIILLIIVEYSCQQAQTDWTTESLDNKHVNWIGLYDDTSKLKIIYHGVKFYQEKDGYDWAFKVKVTYLKNDRDDTLGTYARKKGLWIAPITDLCMPIDKIKYEIYDSDDFLIDSMSVIGEYLKYSDTITFQSKKKISNELKKKFKYAKVNIEAGYFSPDVYLKSK